MTRVSGNITVDSELSSTSENPVQNKVIKSTIDTMQSNFQDGCDSIVQAVTAKGSTPASSSLSDIITAIENISAGGTEGLDDLINYMIENGYNITRNATVEDIVTALEENPSDIPAIERYLFFKYATASTELNNTYVDYTEFTDHILIYGLQSGGLAAGDKTIYIPDYDQNNKQITIN